MGVGVSEKNKSDGVLPFGHGDYNMLEEMVSCLSFFDSFSVILDSEVHIVKRARLCRLQTVLHGSNPAFSS